MSTNPSLLNLERKTLKEQPLRGLRAFETKSFPNAQFFMMDKKNIIVYVRNSMDGIGDAMHMLGFGEDTVKIAKENGYNLIGVLEFGTSLPLNKTDNGIIQTLAKQVYNHVFDRLHILIELLEEDYFTKEALCSDPKEIIDIFREKNTKNIVFSKKALLDPAYVEDCKQACLCVSIDAGSFATTPVNLPAYVHKLIIREYTMNGSSVPYDNVAYAPMGLCKNSEQSDCFGIKMREFQHKTSEEKAKRLLAFNNEKFVKLLLNHDNPELNTAKKYFTETAFFPGYLQSYGSVTVFIVTHVFKHLAEGKLQKNCDFYLNTMGIDINAITQVLTRFTDAKMHIILPEITLSEMPPSNIPCIRIFCRFFLELDDYRALYLITEEGAALSGDTSCIDVFSSENLPFAMQSQSPSQFITQFWLNFDDFVNNFKQFEKLYAYFKILCKEGWHNVKFENLSPLEKTKLIENSCSRVQQLGALLKDPDLQLEWKAFREILSREYNYSKNYVDFILKGSLYTAAELLKNHFESSPTVQLSQSTSTVLADKPKEVANNNILSLLP